MIADAEPTDIGVCGVEADSERLPSCDTIVRQSISKDLHEKQDVDGGDYQRYRGYCGRQIDRVRTSLNFPVDPVAVMVEHLREPKIPTADNPQPTTLPDEVVSFYASSAGIDTAAVDPVVLRLIAAGAEKFIADIISDSKERAHLQMGISGDDGDDKVLKTETLLKVLKEYEIE